MDDKEHFQPPVGSARRRLIRGAFGVPVVLTVASGSVAAASNLNCIQRTGTFPAVFNGTAPPTTDTTIRIRVYKIVSPGSSLWCVRGQDVPPALYTGKVASTFMTSTQVWQFDVSTNKTVGSPLSPPSGTVKAKDYWAALRFAADGTLMGVGQDTTGGYAVTASCWTSFGA